MNLVIVESPAKGKTIEKYTSDSISMIKYFSSESYSDYYYVLGNEFILKKDGEELATIKYDSLDFDLRKSAASIELINDECLLLLFNAKESAPDEKDANKKVTVDLYYAYIYNFSTKTLYPKIVSYDKITKFNNNSEDSYLLLKKYTNFININFIINPYSIYNFYHLYKYVLDF